MTEMETRTVQIIVLPKGQPLFSERATRVEVVDEAAGEFVVIRQEDGEVGINPEEWPELRAAIDRMIAECRETKP